jgi:hypothetical protein
VTDRKQPTTAPPPFDPEEFARSSEHTLRAATDTRLTPAQMLPPPPLNKRVRLGVPAEDLEWFDLSAEARALLARMDGTKTLLELMEGNNSSDLLGAMAELHEMRVLAYEE